MHRPQLPENYCLRMKNGGEYIVKRKITEGGFSLVYEAETLGGMVPIVIKEYFPARGAFRNSQNKVCPLVGNEDSFFRNLDQFNHEGVVGGQVAKHSFQTVSFLSCGDGYALMQEESKDMVSISDLVARWSESPPIPYTGNLKDADPVFTDQVRLKYSLRVIESVLSVLSTIHKNGYLHLDISDRNVIWAGADQNTGRNCAAFIADYGCSVSMSDGIYKPTYQSSYRRGFSAPEVLKGFAQLSPATDIYSVGILLFFLCVGGPALEDSCNRKNQVVRETAYMKLPQRIKKRLIDIICTAIADKDCRYQSAQLMQEEIRELNEMIPTHPINPDNTRSFTLYSLKSMLEGSLETHYSWAHELCDRLDVKFTESNQLIFEPLTWKTFSGDVDFLNWVLPEEMICCLKTKVQTSADSHAAVANIMSGNYPRQWKDELCRVIQSHGTMRLLELSRTILDNDAAFFESQKLLFEILGSEGERLQDCYYTVAAVTGNIRKSPYIGLAIFILYALLGPEGFAKLVPSPSIADMLFYPT